MKHCTDIAERFKLPTCCECCGECHDTSGAGYTETIKQGGEDPASYIGANHERDRIWIVAYADRERQQQQPSRNNEEGGRRTSDGCETLAYSSSTRLQGHARYGCTEEGRSITTGSTGESGLPQGADTKEWWAVEPNVGRVANGVPSRVDRIKSLGNALVPQIPQMIGNWILTREAQWSAVECG